MWILPKVPVATLTTLKLPEIFANHGIFILANPIAFKVRTLQFTEFKSQFEAIKMLVETKMWTKIQIILHADEVLIRQKTGF